MASRLQLDLGMNCLGCESLFFQPVLLQGMTHSHVRVSRVKPRMRESASFVGYPSTIGCASLCRSVDQTDFTPTVQSPYPDEQYAFLLTQRGQYPLAAEILRHILLSNAYLSRELQDSIRIAIISERSYSSSFPTFLSYVPFCSLCYRRTAVRRSCRAMSETDGRTSVQQRAATNTACIIG